MNNTGTQYEYHSIYVDVETGQQLRVKDAINKEKYIIIKTIKHVEYNEHKTKGFVTYTRECRKQPQFKLPFN